MSKEVKSAWIGGICTIVASIIAAIIGVYNFDLNKSNSTLAEENIELAQQNNDLKIAYDNLQSQFDELNNKNISLEKEVSDLKDSIEQYQIQIKELTNGSVIDDELVMVPNLEGIRQEEAVSILESVGLNSFVYVNEEDIGDPYYVAEQSIPAHSKVAIGTVIKLRLVAY